MVRVEHDAVHIDKNENLQQSELQQEDTDAPAKKKRLFSFRNTKTDDKELESDVVPTIAQYTDVPSNFSDILNLLCAQDKPNSLESYGTQLLDMAQCESDENEMSRLRLNANICHDISSSYEYKAMCILYENIILATIASQNMQAFAPLIMRIYDYDDSSVSNLVFGNTLGDMNVDPDDGETMVFRYPEFLNPTLFQSSEFTKFTTDNYNEKLVQQVLAGKGAAESVHYYDSQRFNTDIANRCRNVFRNIFDAGELFDETDTMMLFMDNSQTIQ